jgi:hypothetical protein
VQPRLQTHDCLHLQVSILVVSHMHIHSIGSSHICCEKRPTCLSINITMCYSVCHACMYLYVCLILWSHDCSHVCRTKNTPIFLCRVVTDIREIIYSSIISNFPLISTNSSHYMCEVTTAYTYCTVYSFSETNVLLRIVSIPWEYPNPFNRTIYGCTTVLFHISEIILL